MRAPGAESLTLREHDDIRDAIARGDPQAAEDAMRRHLARANALYLDSDFEGAARVYEALAFAGDELVDWLSLRRAGLVLQYRAPAAMGGSA
mgnify:CR=1 FL=1